MAQKKPITPPNQARPFGVWSPAIRLDAVNNLVWVSGLTARDNQGNVVGIGDMAAQTRQVCENLKSTLEAAGSSLKDVVSVTVYTTDVTKFDEIHRVRREYFPSDAPASTMVQIVRLVEEKCMIEINAVATTSERP